MASTEKLSMRLLTWLLPHRDIVKEGKGLYLRRFYLGRLFGWRLFLHYIARSDDDRDPHDHPWDFATFILKGGYVEEIDMPHAMDVIIAKPGTLHFRAAQHTHQITLRRGPAWTLVLAGPPKRSWGFNTPRGWKDHKEYLGIEKDSYSEDIPKKRYIIGWYR